MIPCRCLSCEVLPIVLREIRNYADGWLSGEPHGSPFFDGEVFDRQITSLLEWAQKRLDGQGEADFLGGTWFKSAMEMVEDLDTIDHGE